MIFTQKLDFFLLLLRFCSQKTIIFLFRENFWEQNRILTIIKSKITYSLNNFPCQLTFISKPISIYIQCLYQHPDPFLQFISILDWFLCRLPCVIIHKKMKTYISEKQNYNSSAAQRINKYTFLSQLSVKNTRNKLVIFFEETYVFIFVYVKPRRAALTRTTLKLEIN